MARELINRIQNIRKDSGFEVTDKIDVQIEALPAVCEALESYRDYVASQTLAVSVSAVDDVKGESVVETDIDEQPVRIGVTRKQAEK